jgi:biopolymer transport protein ExbD
MKKRARISQENPRLQMTPMIDVVFQLLIFFVVAFKQDDILSVLDAKRPAPDKTVLKPPPVLELVQIDVGHTQTGFSMGHRVVTLGEIDRCLAEVASLDNSAPILIRCTDRSRHQKLVEVLDLCAKHGLKKISLFSLDKQQAGGNP